MDDLQVAVLGAWGGIALIAGITLVITDIRSFRRWPLGTAVGATAKSVLVAGMGVVFAAVAVAHFTGIHRQKDLHLFRGLINLLILLALVWLLPWLWQRWGPKKRR